MKITLTNNFHNTSAVVTLSTVSKTEYLTRQRADRISNQLCGSPNCLCGDTPLKTRGPQAVPVEIYAQYQWIKIYVR